MLFYGIFCNNQYSWSLNNWGENAPSVKTSANGLLDKADKPKAPRQNPRTCKFCETFKNPVVGDETLRIVNARAGGWGGGGAIAKCGFSANHDPWYSMFIFYLLRFLTSFLLKKKTLLWQFQ